MKHRVQIDLSFETAADAEAVVADVKRRLGKAVVVKEADGMRDGGYCEYHRCYHDEQPGRACEVVERVEVEKEIVPAKVVVGDAAR